VLPAEDARALKAANPVTDDGERRIDEELQEAGEHAMITSGGRNGAMPRWLVLFVAVAPAALLAGRVVAIADPLTLLDSDNTHHRIRLEGIDAPERGKAQAAAADQPRAGEPGRLQEGDLIDGPKRGRLRPQRCGRDLGLCCPQTPAVLTWDPDHSDISWPGETSPS